MSYLRAGAGLSARRAGPAPGRRGRHRLLHDADDPLSTRATCHSSPGRSPTVLVTSCWVACGAPRLVAAAARLANWRSWPGAAAGALSHCATSGRLRAARRQPLSSRHRGRRSGWPLEMVLRAERRMARRRMPRPYHPLRALQKVTGTVRGTLQPSGHGGPPSMTDPGGYQVAIMAKSPRPARSRPAVPPLTPAQAARLATAAILDTVAAGRSSQARRFTVVLDGLKARGCPSGSR